MATLGVPKKGPHQKIKWLKGLTGDLDDDDSSDTSQPPAEKRERVKKPQKKPQKSKEMAEKKSRATQQEASGSDKDKRRPKKKLRCQDDDESVENTVIVRAAHKIGEKRRLVRRGSDSGKHASKDRSAQSVGSADEGSDENRQRRRLAKGSRLVRRQRSHADSIAGDTAEKGSHAMTNIEPLVDPARAKAADFRQRRMRKLQARRLANDGQRKLATIKLKRTLSSEALKEKKTLVERERRRSLVTGADADVEDEVEVPPLLQAAMAQVHAKEMKREHESPHRTNIRKTDKQGVATLKDQRPSPSDHDGTKRMKRKDEVKRLLNADPNHEPSGNTDAGSAAELFPGANRKFSEPSKCAEGSAEDVKTEDKEVGQVVTPKVTEGTFVQPQEIQDGGSTMTEVKSEDPSLDMLPIPRKAQSGEEHPVIPSAEDEEGQVATPKVTEGATIQPQETQDNGRTMAEGESKDPSLDILPIPRKVPAGEEHAVIPSATSFVIPKRSFVKTATARHTQEARMARTAPSGPRGGNYSLENRIPVAMKPLPPPDSAPHTSNRDPRPQRKRTKNPVPVKNSMFSTQDRSLMRLAKKRNSIFMAAAELSAQVPGFQKASVVTHMVGYEVYDVNGKVLPDLISRLSCATKREMASNKTSYGASFFGVAISAPEAKGKSGSKTDDECGGTESDARKVNCYEELRFERPEDREFYQQRMYGAKFVPQQLRGRITLIVRNARFERKSTGIRFNQDRDREEFSASLSKRYTFNNSVPRCEIPRENWQQLMRNRTASVYLHYYNREDAERASHVFRDDNGNPLEFRHGYKAGVVISRSSSPASAGRLHRTPRRSCSSERGVPEPSPSSSQNNSVRNTPSCRRSKDFEPVGSYDKNGRGRRMYPDDLGRYKGRDNRNGRYDDRRGGSYSRPY